MCACLLGAGDFAGLQAARADVGLTDMALGILDGDLLDIGTKDPVGHAMGVTDVAARRRVLSADFIPSTCCFSLLQTAYAVFPYVYGISPREFRTIAQMA